MIRLRVFILHFRSAIEGCVLVWLILQLLRPYVVETMEGIVDAAGHGEVDFAFDLVPF